MQPNARQLRFRYGEASASELQAVVDEVLTELREDPSEAADRARQAGLDPQQLAGSEVSVREEQQGLEPASTTILVTIVTAVGTHIATKLWDEILWPRLRRRLGAKAVGEKVD
jgi:hypothetical protein